MDAHRCLLSSTFWRSRQLFPKEKLNVSDVFQTIMQLTFDEKVASKGRSGYALIRQPRRQLKTTLLWKTLGYEVMSVGFGKNVWSMFD
jgi:hypothetical protein